MICWVLRGSEPDSKPAVAVKGAARQLYGKGPDPVAAAQPADCVRFPAALAAVKDLPDSCVRFPGGAGRGQGPASCVRSRRRATSTMVIRITNPDPSAAWQ